MVPLPLGVASAHPMGVVPSRPVFRLEVVGRQIEVSDRSIVELGRRVDAVVSSDDNYLTHGGGVSASIWAAAGPDLVAHVDEEKPLLRLGAVHATPAFGIDASVLLHAITVDFDENRRLGPREARELFGRVLDVAGELGCRSIAVPLLGGGAGRLGPRAAAIAFAEAIDERLDVEGPVHTIFAIALGTDNQLVADVFRERLGARSSLDAVVGATAEQLGAQACDELRSAWDRLCDPSNRGADALLGFGDAAFRGLVDLASNGARKALGLDGTLALDPLAAVADTVGAVPLLRHALRLDELTAETALDLADALFGIGSQPLDSANARTWRDALACRNELASSVVGSDDLRLERALIHALRQALHALAPGVPIADGLATPRRAMLARSAARAGIGGRSAARAGIGGRSAARAGLQARSICVSDGEPQPEAPSPVLMPPASSSPQGASDAGEGNRPVRELRDFLRQKLPPAVLAQLCKDLEEQEGYRGSEDLRLLEHCVQMPDPVDFVAHEFSRGDLAGFVEEMTSRAPSPKATNQELATQILEVLGFPRISNDAPWGLHTSLERIRTWRHDFDVVASSHELVTGTVNGAATELERLLQIFIRFLCRVADDASPEEYFRRDGSFGVKDELGSCSIGKLLALLEVLGRDLSSRPSSSVAIDLGVRRLTPADLRIAELRNAFVHYREEMDQLSFSDLRAKARGALDEAIRLLEYLGERDHRVFPHVVVIDEIRVDRWGRRKIEARSDEGRELLFTNRDVRPGQVYFMHPLTNPMRVDPILASAGDFAHSARLPR